LKERGLVLNTEKTQYLRWTMGKKLDFLGWTFHLISPKQVNWLTDLPKSVSTRLKNRTKLYVYPSNKSTSRLREIIKDILSMSNVGLTPEAIIKRLNEVICGWSNYFIPTANQYALRANLDNYIFKRCLKWIFKKYGRKGYLSAVKGLLMENNPDKPKVLSKSMQVSSRSSNSIIKVKTLRTVIAGIPMWLIKPTNEMKHSSMLVNPNPYLKRAIYLSKNKGDIRAILIQKQDYKCPICNNNFIEFDHITQWSEEIDIALKNNILENNTTNVDVINVNYSNHELSNSANSNINLLNKTFEPTWYSNLQIDHIVPKLIQNNIPEIESILDNEDNKYLTHHICQKLKTKIDNEFLMKEFRLKNKNNLKKYGLNHENKQVEIKTMNEVYSKKDLITTYLDKLTLIYGEKTSKQANVRFIKLKNLTKKMNRIK